MTANVQNAFALGYEAMTEEDIPALTAVMTRAFDDDAQRHQGRPHGGPDGYDNGDFFRKWAFGYRESAGYKVMLNGDIVAGFIVWLLPHGNNILGTVFVDPAMQSRGIGTAIWRHIETTFPAKSWTLETPVWATSNHRFYTHQCGFTRVEQKGDSVVYRKMMPQPTL